MESTPKDKFATGKHYTLLTVVASDQVSEFRVFVLDIIIHTRLCVINYSLRSVVRSGKETRTSQNLLEILISSQSLTVPSL